MNIIMITHKTSGFDIYERVIKYSLRVICVLYSKYAV